MFMHMLLIISRQTCRCTCVLRLWSSHKVAIPHCVYRYRKYCSLIASQHSEFYESQVIYEIFELTNILHSNPCPKHYKLHSHEVTATHSPPATSQLGKVPPLLISTALLYYSYNNEMQRGRDLTTKITFQEVCTCL